MKITQLGEFEFIKHIAKQFNKIPSSLVGIGDDCAVIDYDNSTSMLVTTDMLVEDVHFIRSKISAFELGKKSVAVNISDICAMGGKPYAAFVSIGIPLDVNFEWLDELYKGIAKMLDNYGVYLLGGDTTRSPAKIIINLAVVGYVEKRYIKLRSGASVGDMICVTGNLGDSACGLQLLLENIQNFNQDELYLINAHNCPTPHFEEGIWLSHVDAVSSMMDVSDGIDSDIRRIMEMSNCSAEIYLENLPISMQLQNVSKKYNWDKYELAAAGGEDYCLLITIRSEDYPNVAKEFEKKFSRPLNKIGKIFSWETPFSYYLNGEKVYLKSKGFDHFRCETNNKEPK